MPAASFFVTLARRDAELKPLPGIDAAAESPVDLLEVLLPRRYSETKLSIGQIQEQDTAAEGNAPELIRHKDFESLVTIDHNRVLFGTDEVYLLTA